MCRVIRKVVVEGQSSACCGIGEGRRHLLDVAAPKFQLVSAPSPRDSIFDLNVGLNWVSRQKRSATLQAGKLRAAGTADGNVGQTGGVFRHIQTFNSQRGRGI